MEGRRGGRKGEGIGEENLRGAEIEREMYWVMREDWRLQIR